MADPALKPEWDARLIRTYNISGPRYTSYPTAPQLDSNWDRSQRLEAVKRANRPGKNSPLSLYFHIPFCDTVCYYCACNKIISANKQLAAPYLQRLAREMEIQSRFFNPGGNQPPVVEQLHWGGGTPTYLSDCQKQQLMKDIGNHFQLLKDDSGDYSIEVHPGQISHRTIPRLRQLGFNRLSMGVQDFNPDVQKAVNRFNSIEQVEQLITAARREQFHSISMDIIYGLPRQNLQTIKTTLDQVIDLSPDRLSLFNYAHMPHLFKTQRQIDQAALPSAGEKLQMLHSAIEQLCAAGYVYIGMDHFAIDAKIIWTNRYRSSQTPQNPDDRNLKRAAPSSQEALNRAGQTRH